MDGPTHPRARILSALLILAVITSLAGFAEALFTGGKHGGGEVIWGAVTFTGVLFALRPNTTEISIPDAGWWMLLGSGCVIALLRVLTLPAPPHG